MKVLIAGATGAIGRPLLSCLEDAGHELFALIRSRKAAGTREATRAHQVVADALDAASMLDVVQRPDQYWPMRPPRLRLTLRPASLPDAGTMPIWKRRHRNPG